MKHKISLFFLFIGFSVAICGQTSAQDSLPLLFHQQLETFLQEKIHLHTDKPHYISGEKIWFRAHLVDAVSHVPFPVSMYVYVELINPMDSVVARVKIRQENDAYHGNLPIPEDVPEGDYTIRAYTAFMRSQDEHYFCTKTIRISDPQARRVHTETQFVFETDRRVRATFRFASPPQSPQMEGRGEPIVPKSVKISINNGTKTDVNINDDGTAAVNFNLPATSRKRVLFLEIVVFQNLYRQFIKVPVPDNDFDVAFFPEGGSLMQGVACKIAFKAMKSNGQATGITGIVYDQSGVEIMAIKSDHLGMGNFRHLAEKGKTYYVICTNDKGQTKRFELPAAIDYGYALAVNQIRNRIMVSVLKPEESTRKDELYLIAHIRGTVYLSIPWDHEISLVLQKEQFPSGVMHFILFDANKNPISERLVFINNNDQAQVSLQPDREQFSARSLVKNKVTLTDSKGEPLTGNFSVSVTSDREVISDTTSNILTQLLLTSDLYGFIENPAFYFQNTPEAASALDFLMLTQGWRRYNIANLAQSRFSQPAFSFETGTVISGTVKSTILGRSVEGLDVNIWSYDGKYFDNTKTDKDGRFYFQGDFPDSTRFMVSAVPRRGITSMVLIPDVENFPERTLPTIPLAAINRNQLTKYADKAEQQYVFEHGERINLLSEVTISAERRPVREAQLALYQPLPPSHTITEKNIEEFPASDMFMLLSRIPGVVIRSFGDIVDNETIKIRGGSPMVVVDDIPTDVVHLTLINPEDVEQIDVIKIAGALPFFESPRNYVPFSPSGSAIMIYLKKGRANSVPLPPSYTKSIMPLGYQQPVEFYAPKYDTPEKKQRQFPDLRTTIHWEPVVQSDGSGIASFEYYTADEITPYTVIIEGVTNDGTIIRQEGK